MSITPAERTLLRDLAKQVAEIAALPVQQQTLNLWKANNALKPVRPMVMIDQLPWHEMNVDDELTLQTKDKFARSLENKLRRKLYRWRHMRADYVVESKIEIPIALKQDNWGVVGKEEAAVTDPQNDVYGHYYLDRFKDDDDLAKFHALEFSIDPVNAENEEQARAILEGLLQVQMTGMEMWFCPWDRLVQWHGVENSLWDIADRPEFLHRVMRKFLDANFELLERLEKQDLLAPTQSWIHCGGGFTDELPAPDFSGHYRAKDVWTAGMAQIFSTVSPQTHNEFEIEYQIPWYSRFGLGYYGCCEPLDSKIDIIRRIPNVRKISMSPWVNVENGAAQLASDYVFSRKPSPAFLAEDAFNADAVEKDLRQTMDVCRRNKTPLEFILKDISTVRYDPKRLWAWNDLAMRLVNG